MTKLGDCLGAPRPLSRDGGATQDAPYSPKRVLNKKKASHWDTSITGLATHLALQDRYPSFNGVCAYSANPFLGGSDI